MCIRYWRRGGYIARIAAAASRPAWSRGVHWFLTLARDVPCTRLLLLPKVCGIVLEETKHRNAAAYARLRALCASPQRRFFAFSNEHHRETYVGLAAKVCHLDRVSRHDAA